MITAICNRAPKGAQDLGATAAPHPAVPAHSTQQEEFITKDEVARRLKKTARTIEHWQQLGYIPFIKAGHSVLYKWSDVEAHLQSNFRVCRLRNGKTILTRNTPAAQ